MVFFSLNLEGTSCTTVNRQCSSGLQAVAQVAAAIRFGFYEIGIAGGVESMSLDEMPSAKVPINFLIIIDNARSN
jgi:acetyl-CoA acyltransferase 1